MPLRIILDQNVPRAFGNLIAEHEVSYAAGMGGAELTNGELLAAAERAEFDVMITADKNLAYQQNLAGRRIAIVVLSTNHWPTLKDASGRVLQALEACSEGTYQEVALERPKLRRRPAPEPAQG